MATKPYKNPNYVPVDLIFTIGVGKNSYAERFSDFIEKHNHIGNLTWEKFYELDTRFANEIKELTETNKIEFEKKYNPHGANKKKLEIKRKMKSKVKKTYKIKSQIEKTNDAIALLKKDINSLKLQEIKQIITYGNLEFEALKPYYERLQYLKNNPKNYIKPNYSKTAQGLLTFNFGKKANPIKWIDNKEIIMSKLYSAKMGIKYLEANNKKALIETMNLVRPKLDEVLKSLGYNDVNDVKF